MNEFVCANCGHEQDSMLKPCDKCLSYRIVSIKFLEGHFGKNWREECFALKE